MKFCPNHHMLELVEVPTSMYACVDCQQLYELQGETLVAVLYRFTHGKDPFFMAEEAKAARRERWEQHERMRNDLSLQALYRRVAQVDGARR